MSQQVPMNPVKCAARFRSQNHTVRAKGKPGLGQSPAKGKPRLGQGLKASQSANLASQGGARRSGQGQARAGQGLAKARQG